MIRREEPGDRPAKLELFANVSFEQSSGSWRKGSFLSCDCPQMGRLRREASAIHRAALGPVSVDTQSYGSRTFLYALLNAWPRHTWIAPTKTKTAGILSTIRSSPTSHPAPTARWHRAHAGSCSRPRSWVWAASALRSRAENRRQCA
jgi:hypothetical protein